MTFEPEIRGETKATSQHQITIPKRIWNELRLKSGARFQITLTEDRLIMVTPKLDDLELSDAEWQELKRLARSKSNITKSFTNTKKALRYLRAL